MASHGNVHVINSRNEWEAKLEEAKTSNRVVVVDFTAVWCGPCKFIAPFFADLSEAYPGLVFLKVDVDDLSDISAQYEVRAMPTFVFIKNGEIIHRLVGADKGKLEKKVKEYAV